MAALVEGHQYGLSSENSTSVQKSVIHCKLTDSALKAFEEFQRIKKSNGEQPSIQFQGQNGVIKVPMMPSSDNPDPGMRRFSFSLSTIPLDPKGSLECIKQTSQGGHQELDMLGAMLYKVSIQGTDDSYRTARERMTKAEEESKKQRAKEVKSSGPYSGMRIKKKVVRKPVPVPPVTSQHQNLLGSEPQKPSPNSFKPVAPPVRHPGHRDEHSTVATTTHVHRPSTLPNLSKAALSASHNAAVINMPFRDRVVHLLAVRPYKTPELLIRLQKDGIKEKDKSMLSQVLTQVGLFNPRDKNYSLAKHVYTEVRQDWPHYTDFDRRLLKRKMTQLQEPTLSANTSPAVSPCHSTSSQGSPNNSQKRLIEDEKSTDHPQKKQRIAHGNLGNNISNRTGSVVPSNKPTAKSSPKIVSPESPSNQENNNLLDTSSLNNQADYVRKYASIASSDQRQKYKSDFNTEYKEYRELHTKIEQITNRFMELKDQLNKQSKDTVDYKNIRKKIMYEYRQVKNDSKYMEQRGRHDYLHHKLGHIKKLITEFDQSRLGVS